MHYGPTMMETKLRLKQFEYVEPESNVCKLFEEFYICMYAWKSRHSKVDNNNMQ